jgi:hypothetical protein
MPPLLKDFGLFELGAQKNFFSLCLWLLHHSTVVSSPLTKN